MLGWRSNAIYASAVQRSFPDAEVGALLVHAPRHDVRRVHPRRRRDQRLHGPGTIVGSVAAGQFPMYPGADGYFGPENCKWCAFDRVCPRDRARRFERRRDDPALEAITSLAEHDWVPDGDVDHDADVEVDVVDVDAP